MKRKTNLFYTTGPDSKFITFSNYTESLTGNFLSTDTKIFPSRFIALYIKGLNKNTKASLIKYLADYYESKLAVLRDHFDYNKSDIEKRVPPLNYLLEALLRIKEIKENEVVVTHSVAANVIKDDNETSSSNESNLISDSDVIKFKYISDITEQDYNGTFTDTICNIDLRKFAYISSIELTDDFNDNVVQFDKPAYLYGWDSDVPEEYTYEHTIPDSIQGIDLDRYMTAYLAENITSEDETDTIEETDITEETSSTTNNKRIEYIIDTTLANVIDIREDKIIDGIDVTLADIIAKEMNVEHYDEVASEYNDVASAISAILHSTDSNLIDISVLMSFQNKLNDLLSNEAYDIIIFYDSEHPDFLYAYNGADVVTLDMSKNNEYNIDPEVLKLNISTSNDEEMEFNCIIPLYDIVDINYKSNFNTIERIISVNGEGEIDLTPSVTNKMYCTNVPLGMWFYTDGDAHKDGTTSTTSMKLYLDTESGFSQSWSLTIASQFKPFPYSSKMPSELTTNSNTNAYATFAQVLASQSAMIDNFNKLTRTIAYMNDHIRNMESQLANLGTSYNIDNIHREFNNFEINMNNKFNVLKDDVISQLSYLKWHTTI